MQLARTVRKQSECYFINRKNNRVSFSLDFFLHTYFFRSKLFRKS